jgi:two-component sensor histidine kinase
MGSAEWLVLLGFSAVLSAGLAALVWVRHGQQAGARFLAVLLAAGCVWTVGYAGEVTAATAGVALLWLKLQYVGIVAAPVALLLFVFEYTGRDGPVSPGIVAGLLVVPVVTLAAVWLEPGHGLFQRVAGFESVSFPLVGTATLAVYDQGPLYAVWQGYANLLVLASLAPVGHLLVRRDGDYRDQALVLLAAILAPSAGNLLAWSLAAVTVDPVPFLLAVTGGAITLGLYRSDLLEVVPVDRGLVFDQVPGPVLVLDADGRVVEANREAAVTFGRAGDAPVGRHVDDLLRAAGFDATFADLQDGDEVTVSRESLARSPPEAGVTPGSDTGSLGSGTCSDPGGGDAPATGADASPSARTGETVDEGSHYEVSREPIRTWLGGLRGHLLLFYDVSERRRTAASLARTNTQLTVLHRLLRHDVRNDLAVTLGWGREALEATDDPEVAAMLERVVGAADHAEELTVVGRDIVESVVVGGSPPLEPVDLGALVEECVLSARIRYPEATFDAPESYPEATVLANPVASSVFTNLLNNAVQHSDREAPLVGAEMRVDRDGGVVHVTVTDDGPGIPDDQKETLFGRGEMGLGSSGSGLGLYLVDQLVSAFDGDVDVTDNEPRGTRVAVTLPLATAGPTDSGTP